MSQMETENFRLSIEEMNIPEVVCECLELMQYKYKVKGIPLTYKQISRMPRFKCDKNRYKQVLLNLLGNAIKFTEKGGVTITTNYDSAANKLLTTVKDTGVGIRDEDKGKLFTFFGKLDDPCMLNQQGAGLGLFICRKLTEAMGGYIKLESEYMKGSTITFAVKNRQDPSEEMYEKDSDLSSSSYIEENINTNETPDVSLTPLCQSPYAFYAKFLSRPSPIPLMYGKKVLIIDDEFICAKVIQSYLKTAGVEGDTVHHTIEFIGIFWKSGN
jgi:hypothetical protein